MYRLITIFAIVGILLASYLLYSFYVRPAVQPCSINDVINCDAVIKGEVSTLFGIPAALYGFIGYTAILLSALVRQRKLIFGFALFGLLFCLRITCIELFILKVVYPICLVCQLDMLAVFICSLVLLRRPSPPHRAL